MDAMNGNDGPPAGRPLASDARRVVLATAALLLAWAELAVGLLS
ncbi:hypothetical protein [uncultured Massilia sp.]|nr:hypothetical protein [uncultured Massilia sp.]